MCNLYSITTNQEAIRALFRVITAGGYVEPWLYRACIRSNGRPWIARMMRTRIPDWRDKKKGQLLGYPLIGVARSAVVREYRHHAGTDRRELRQWPTTTLCSHRPSFSRTTKSASGPQSSCLD